MPIERRRVLYEGRVQGVGFRYTASRLAASYAVAGSVRNLPDGRVEILVEGDPAEVSRFLDAVAGVMEGKIRDMHQTVESPGDEPLSGFSIRY